MVTEVAIPLKAKHQNNDYIYYITNNLKQCDDSKRIDSLLLTNTVELTCSYDMVWSKRAGGRIYDSVSDHGFLVEVERGKIVGWGVKKKNIVSAIQG